MEVTVEAPENKQANKQKTLDYQIAQEYPYRGHTQRTLCQHTLDTHILMSTVCHTITWNQDTDPAWMSTSRQEDKQNEVHTHNGCFSRCKEKAESWHFIFRKLDEVGNHCVNEISQARKDKHFVFSFRIWV